MRILYALALVLLFSSVNGQEEIEFHSDKIVVPRTTIASVNNPVEGILIYDTSSASFKYYDGSSWKSM